MTSILKATLVLVAALTVLAGCASAGSEQKLDLLRVDFPLREPAWVPGKEVVLALSEDRRRVARVAVGEATPNSRVSVRSQGFEDVGENLAANPEEPDVAYLPRPERGGISVLDTDSLREVDSYDAGDAPAYVTLDVQSEILFSLSDSGSSVSGVSLETAEKVPTVEVGGGAASLVEAPEKGLDPAFWVAGPDGVAFYGGDPPEIMVGRPIEAADVAVDLTGSQRIYVAEGGRIVALEGDPERLLEGELLVDATRNLGEKVERVASDELHVFAVAGERLVAMRRETLEVAETVEFGWPLEREGITSDVVSGITVGKEDVYLTFEGEPYILSVKKP